MFQAEKIAWGSLLFFLLVIGSFACETTPNEPFDTGYDYFPLETGQFIIYDVTETNYSLTGLPTVKSYQIRELVTQPFTDLSGQESYRVERSSRDNEAQVWKLDSVWLAKRTIDQATRTENNLTFIKLNFPVRKGLRWNGNALNNLGGKEADKDDYLIDDVSKSIKLGTQSFDKVVVIKQQDDSTLVNLDRRTEMYARSIGLIYKEITQLAYCYQQNCLGKGQVDFGIKKVQKIKSYGKM